MAAKTRVLLDFPVLRFPFSSTDIARWLSGARAMAYDSHDDYYWVVAMPVARTWRVTRLAARASEITPYLEIFEAISFEEALVEEYESREQLLPMNNGGCVVLAGSRLMRFAVVATEQSPVSSAKVEMRKIHTLEVRGSTPSLVRYDAAGRIFFLFDGVNYSSPDSPLPYLPSLRLNVFDSYSLTTLAQNMTRFEATKLGPNWLVRRGLRDDTVVLASYTPDQTDVFLAQLPATVINAANEALETWRAGAPVTAEAWARAVTHEPMPSVCQFEGRGALHDISEALVVDAGTGRNRRFYLMARGGEGLQVIDVDDLNTVVGQLPSLENPNVGDTRGGAKDESGSSATPSRPSRRSNVVYKFHCSVTPGMALVATTTRNAHLSGKLPVPLHFSTALIARVPWSRAFHAAWAPSDFRAAVQALLSVNLSMREDAGGVREAVASDRSEQGEPGSLQNDSTANVVGTFLSHEGSGVELTRDVRAVREACPRLPLELVEMIVSHTWAQYQTGRVLEP